MPAAAASSRVRLHPAQYFGDLLVVPPQELDLLLQILGQRFGPLTARTDLAESKARGTGTIGRTMIEHLRGRERALRTLWMDRAGSGMDRPGLSPQRRFHRAQFCHYFDANRKRALRFVKALVERRAAVESEWPVVNGGGKSCRISSKPIYRALGIENIRHRRKTTVSVLRRRLLSFDFVLEHPGMNLLPTEGEKAMRSLRDGILSYALVL